MCILLQLVRYSFFALAIVSTLSAYCQDALVADQQQATQQPPTQQQTNQQKTTGQQTPTDIRGTAGENGITVGRAKVFDNRTLTLMLESLSDTLKGLQVIDQDSLRKSLGLLQGSQTRDVARSFSITAGGTPEITSTLNQSTETSTERKRSTANGTKDDQVNKDYVESLVDKTVNDKLGLTTQTKTSERLPSVPTLPDLISAPTGTPAFGQNALDLLSDQVNLTYQIFNVRMLLERSLSDRLQADGDPRLQAVLGFNVEIDPPRDAENAAAVVEITVGPVNNKAVSLVAMMPQEKTYNSMALNTKSNAFGGSAVARMVTVGYSERRRGQIFYLFRDNDTLSFERMMTNTGTLTFGWQFRPVLGRKSVASGMRQMFAVISLPAPDKDDSPNPELQVSVRTHWRKYYADTLTSADPSEIGPWPHLKRFVTLGLTHPVPNEKTAWREEKRPTDSVVVPTTAYYQAKLEPKVTDVAWTRVDDKTALISVKGANFFTGTSVVLGGSTSNTNVIIKSTQAMDIVTPIENVGAGTAMIIGRYGRARPLEIESGCVRPTPQTATLSDPFGGQRELRALVRGCAASDLERQVVVFVNGKSLPGRPYVFTDSNDSSLTQIVANVPVDLIPKGEGMIKIVNTFRQNSLRFEFPWYDNPYDVQRMPAGSKTFVLVRRKDGVPFNNAVFGATPKWRVKFAGADITPDLSIPSAIQIELPTADPTGPLVLLEPNKDHPDNPRVFLLDLPPAQPKAKVAVEPASGTSLTISQNDALKLDFTGEKIDTVSTVRVEGKDALRTEYTDEKKLLSVYLTQETTKFPGKIALQFRDSAGKQVATLILEIKASPKAPSAPAAPGTSPSQKEKK